MRKSVIMALAALTTAVVFGDVTGSILTEQGESHKGVIGWRNKAYSVTSKGGISIEVREGDVAELDIDKPAALDAAIALVEKGSGKDAIATLQKIMKEYAHLKWDLTAAGYLARAHLSAGKPDDALSVCRSVIGSDEKAAYLGEMAPAYWDTLLALGRREALEKALEKAAKKGDRASSGAALIKRGDILMKEGKESSDAAKKALSDGYLRVVLLYRDAPQIQPEALYKAAQCFEKLQQSGRADSMRQQLKQVYPSSPWASK